MSALDAQSGHMQWHATLPAGPQPSAGLRSWLTEPGLLTARLRNNCVQGFRMRVLHDAISNAGAGLHREVLLCCGDAVCIYAITDVPAATLAAHDWLAGLGEEPLGETLRDRADVSRSAFEYALLDPRNLPVEAGEQRAEVWARRSTFTIGTAPLTVTEVFLPGLQSCNEGAQQ